MTQQTLSPFSIQLPMEHIIINDETMPPYKFGRYNTLIIKAVMGLGKTNALYDYININKNKSILIVSFRVTLEEKYSDDLPEFCIYNKINGNIEPQQYPHMIIQIDSLHRIRGNYDIVVFDEFTYTVSHLITSCKTREKVYECMKQVIKENNKTIFMDAFIDEEIIDWISKFPNRKIKYIENKYTIHSDKKVISYKYDINNFIKSLKESLKNNEKIVIASNNKTELKNIENIINKNFPKLRKLFITKETKNKYNIKEWKNLDVLAYTPTITAGVSFTDKRFDKVYGLFCNNTSPADMSIQQLFRVRNIYMNEYHICCKITGKKDYPLDDEGIEKYIIDNEKCLVSGVKGIKLDYIKNEIKKDKYFYLYKYIQKKIFKSNNEYMEYMIELLKLQGIKDISFNCTFNKEETKIYNKEYREYRAEMKDLECEMIVNSPLIDDETEKEIEKDYNKTYEQVLTLKKHTFLKLSKISHDVLTKDVYKKYNKNISQLYNICYMHCFKDNIYEHFNKRLNIYLKNNVEESTIKRLHHDKKLEKRIYANDIVLALGFNSVFDSQEINIDKNTIINYILNNYKNLEMLFGTNKHDWEDIINNDNKYFSRIMRYLNDRIHSIFKLRIVLNKKSKKYYIKGLDYWNDDTVTYKNPVLINHIIDKNNEFYLDDEINDIAKEMKDEDPDIIIENDEQNNFDENYIPPNQYIYDYNKNVKEKKI